MKTKEIHIEKYDFDSFQKEQKPFVMILTHVIQHLPPDRAHEFAMWVYLESLPVTWKPNKQHLMERFSISAKTYERRMEWLNTVGLIEYRQKRNSTGLFGKGELIVLSGIRFNLGAASNGTVKIDGTDINKKKSKVIHIFRSNGTDKIDYSVPSSETPALIEFPTAPPNSQFTEVPLNDAHINTTIKNKKERKKINNEKSVFVFSDALSVKNHVDLLIANRGDFVEEEIIDQIVFYSFEQNNEKNFDSIVKRINIGLKKVREGKWNVPQGYNGITSQSIRKNEEQQQAEKKWQSEDDALRYRAIVKTVERGEGLKHFSELVKNLKRSVYGHNNT